MSPVELIAPPPDPGPVAPSMEPQAAILATALASQIEFGMASSDRARQREVGASELGMPCPRRLGYRAAGYPKINYTDPMKLLLGIGIHLGLAQIYCRLNDFSERYLVEFNVEHSGVPGQLDLYDRGTATVIDWKTTSRGRLAKYAKDGPPVNYVTQINLYARGLVNAGFPVKRVAIAFLPYDGLLSGLWVWLAEPNFHLVDEAVERLAQVKDSSPADLPSVPGRHCSYCDFYNAQATDLRLGCPGT